MTGTKKAWLGRFGEVGHPYSHPTTKQCNYSYTHPSTKQCDAAAGSHNHSASNITTGTLPVARGGTGVTTNPSLLVNLAATAAASVFATSPRPGVTGTLSVANGGTGVTTLDALKSALGLSSSSLKVTTGTYTGNGRFGYNNKSTLTSNFKPILTVISQAVRTGNDWRSIAILADKMGFSYHWFVNSNYFAIAPIDVTTTDTGISWYCTQTGLYWTSFAAPTQLTDGNLAQMSSRWTYSYFILGL